METANEFFAAWAKIIWKLGQNKIAQHKPPNAKMDSINLKSFDLSEIREVLGHGYQFLDKYKQTPKSWWELFELFFPSNQAMSRITNRHFRLFYTSYFKWINEERRLELWGKFAECDYVPASFGGKRLRFWEEGIDRCNNKVFIIQKKKHYGKVPSNFGIPKRNLKR